MNIMSISTILLFGMPGGMEWIFIILAVVLLFGGRKIPELMRGIGQGIREFNNAKSNVREQIREGMNEEPKKEAPKETKEEKKDNQ